MSNEKSLAQILKPVSPTPPKMTVGCCWTYALPVFKYVSLIFHNGRILQLSAKLLDVGFFSLDNAELCVLLAPSVPLNRTLSLSESTLNSELLVYRRVQLQVEGSFAGWLAYFHRLDDEISPAVYNQAPKLPSTYEGKNPGEL